MSFLSNIFSLIGARKVAKIDGFARLSEQYSQRINGQWRNLSDSPPGLDSKRAAFLVTPWLLTPLPYFAIECGLAALREGIDVEFIVDSADVFFNAVRSREIFAIERVIQQLPNKVKVFRVTTDKTQQELFDDSHLEQLLYENAVQLHKGEHGTVRFLEENPSLRNAMRTHIRAVQKTLENRQPDWLFLPGGVWGLSGLYAHIADTRGIPYISYDSGPGEVFISRNGPAAHFPDVPKALEIWSKLPVESQNSYVAVSQQIIDERMEGRDEFRLQPSPRRFDSTKSCDLLLALNYRADTAALCRTKAFPSVAEWVLSVCRWVEERGDLELVIRQHPCERIPEFRGSDNWQEKLKRFGSFGTKIRFVAAEDDINTYDLLASAKVVLPFTSRVGIEAAVFGKPVVLGTRCFYAGCGFTADAATADEYFARISEALDGRIVQDEASRQRAGLCYYIIERCLSLKTTFTPQPHDFSSWVSEEVNELWSKPAQKVLLQILASQESVPVLVERYCNQWRQDPVTHASCDR